MNYFWRIFCFFLGHCWSDWLMGMRVCWMCSKVQTFNEFKEFFESQEKVEK